MEDEVSEPLFKIGDKVKMHNSGNQVFTIDRVYLSDSPRRSHKYSVEGNSRPYYESVFTKHG